ncbi:MAG: tRNA-dihydrouridine synthase C [Planctomycetota bacterium]|jgi:tRNA-dihydrouridine synthase C
MEGVTTPDFRGLVLSRNSAQSLGGATTEFVRVVDAAIPVAALEKALGCRSKAFGRPVGLQIMGSNLEAMARTAVHAAEAGAPFVDINFGCPAKGALRGMAGSSTLDDPRRVFALVHACSRAMEGGHVPLTAKIRAGGEDDTLLEDLARATEDGGASLLTVHCRTRKEAYRDTADWNRLSRAVQAVQIPVCGNGGMDTAPDMDRMMSETGCQFAMIGRAALGNPWVFSGHQANAREAADFLLEYAQLTAGSQTKQSRVKQLLACWTAGGPEEAGLLGSHRRPWLRVNDDSLLRAALNAAGDQHPAPLTLT